MLGICAADAAIEADIAAGDASINADLAQAVTVLKAQNAMVAALSAQIAALKTTDAATNARIAALKAARTDKWRSAALDGGCFTRNFSISQPQLADAPPPRPPTSYEPQHDSYRLSATGGRSASPQMVLARATHTQRPRTFGRGPCAVRATEGALAGRCAIHEHAIS